MINDLKNRGLKTYSTIQKFEVSKIKKKKLYFY